MFFFGSFALATELLLLALHVVALLEHFPIQDNASSAAVTLVCPSTKELEHSVIHRVELIGLDVQLMVCGH